MEVSKMNSVNFGQVFYTQTGKKPFKATEEQTYAKDLFKEVADSSFKSTINGLDRELNIDIYFVENERGNVYLEMRQKPECNYHDNYRGQYIFSDDMQLSKSPKVKSEINRQIAGFLNFCTEYYITKRPRQ